MVWKNMKQILKTIFLAVVMLMNMNSAVAERLIIPERWALLENILVSRQEQKESKMKLTSIEVSRMVSYLQSLDSKSLIHTQNLQKRLPKTTVELLFAVQLRGVSPFEVEKMAAYLKDVPDEYNIKNIAAFDENTSHIIGRD